jgi:hypothetical protein
MVFCSSFHVLTALTNRKNAIHYENFLFTPRYTQVLRRLNLICFETIKYDLKNLSSISSYPLFIGNNSSHTFQVNFGFHPSSLDVSMKTLQSYVKSNSKLLIWSTDKFTHEKQVY